MVCVAMPLSVKGFQKKGDVKAKEAGPASEDAAAIEAARLLLVVASPFDATFSGPSPCQVAAKRRRSDADSLSEDMRQSEWHREEAHTQFLLERNNVELTGAKTKLRWKGARAAAAVRWSGYVEDAQGAAGRPRAYLNLVGNVLMGGA